MRRRICTILAAVLLPVMAWAGAVETALPGAKLRGEAAFRFLGAKLYTGRLYTRGGGALDWNQEFALELTYARRLSRRDLVEATLRELDRQGAPRPDRARVETCFRAVQPGDRFLAVSQGRDAVGFWFNDQPSCVLKAPNIKRDFMSIFLGPKSRSKRFTQGLLNP